MSGWMMKMVGIATVVLVMVGTSMVVHALASPFQPSSTSFSTKGASRGWSSHPLFSIRSGATDDVNAAASATTATTAPAPPPRHPKVPVTVLSGFLGSGKTTLLQRLLENKEGLRVGVVVNDVAAVNIDSKLLLEHQQSQPRDNDVQVLQLSNGCACCSLADELLASVAELFTVADMTNPTRDPQEPPYHHIVIELSGVSSPSAVRSNFQDAANWLNMPLMERVQLDTMVTVVDTSTFLSLLKHGRIVVNQGEVESSLSSEAHPQQSHQQKEDQEDAWTKDLPPGLVEALKAGQEAYFGDDGPHNPMRDELPSSTSQLSDLLVEQVEVADIVLLNKVDLLDDNPVEQMARMERIIQALNARATVYRTRFGKIQLSASEQEEEEEEYANSIADVGRILAFAKGLGAASSGVVDDHRDAIAAAMKQQQQQQQDDHDHEHHNHEHSHEHDDHQHSHANHDHHHSHDDHDHHHHHSHDDHDHHHHSHDDHDHHHHSHGDHDHHHHSHDDHDHHHHSHDDHDHHHHHDAPVVVAHGGGIGTFVYQARRPFHPQRLASTVLRRLPVVKTAMSTESDEHLAVSDSEFFSQLTEVLGNVLRSKGFTWLAHSNIGAMYWSHAGSAFEMQCLGRWWATLPRDQWPPEAAKTILADFDNIDHNEESENEETVGDRRQELVFIGPQMDNPSYQDCIRKALDKCLVNDEEWENYQTHRGKESSLLGLFPNPLLVRMLG